LSVDEKRALWQDYNDYFRGMAFSVAASIDHWYHALARSQTESAYWRHRGNAPTFDLRDNAFSNLIDTVYIERGLYGHFRDRTAIDELVREGSSFFPTAGDLLSKSPADSARVSLAKDVRVRESVMLGNHNCDLPGEYWKDPVKVGAEKYGETKAYRSCHRFFRSDSPAEGSVPFFDGAERGVELYERLRNQSTEGGRPFGMFKRELTQGQIGLLSRLRKHGLVEVA
jgi:hypothetical protein